MKNVMAKAWEIARVAKIRFGGKVKPFFAMSLKKAWKVVKDEMEVLKQRKSMYIDGKKLIEREFVKGQEISLEVGQGWTDGRIPYYVKKDGEVTRLVFNRVEAENFYNLEIAFARR